MTLARDCTHRGDFFTMQDYETSTPIDWYAIGSFAFLAGFRILSWYTFLSLVKIIARVLGAQSMDADGENKQVREFDADLEQ
jgi:hypothetical protein